eukprot:gene39677-63411_t
MLFDVEVPLGATSVTVPDNQAGYFSDEGLVGNRGPAEIVLTRFDETGMAGSITFTGDGLGTVRPVRPDRPIGSDRHRSAHLVERSFAALPAAGDPARLEHVVPVGRAQREADVLFDEEHGEVASPGELDDDLFDLLHDVRLDALGRLVEDQQRRVGQQGT